MLCDRLDEKAPRGAIGALLSDRRGASFVQMLILLVILGLGGVASVRKLRESFDAKTDCTGQSIATLTVGGAPCAEAGGSQGAPNVDVIAPPGAQGGSGEAEDRQGGISGGAVAGGAGAEAGISAGAVAGGAGAKAGDRVPIGKRLAGRDPRPEDLDLAKLSADVYEQEGTDLAGFRRLSDEELAALGISRRDLENSRNGFRAAVYEKDGEFVVAFAGTDPTQLGDLGTDARQGLGFNSGQFEMAQALGEKITASVGDNVVFTGHSLGGGLASQAALSTGGTAVTFNSSGLSDNSIRRAGLDPKTARASAAESGQIRAFRNHNDPLTAAQELTITIPLGVKIESPLPNAVGTPIVVSGDGHGIGGVVEGLERDLKK